MSKIICEVCGTAYPETATQCPICGSAHKKDAKDVPEKSTSGNAGSGSYTYVKGGRFSKANVKKRNQYQQQAAASVSDVEQEVEEPKRSSNKWLIVIALVLLVCVIAVIAYLATNFMNAFFPGGSITDITNPSETSESTEAEVPCESLYMENSSITLNLIGAASLLNVYSEPEDTTDTFTFTSSDESVATVTESGKVVAVGSGEAIITITCGNATTTCVVQCVLPEETTEATEEPTTEPPTEEPTEAPTEAPTEETGEFSLNRKDFTMSASGESWVLYNGDLKDEIVWTSADEEIATVESGKVVAVAPGTTTIYAEYNGTKLECIVRCTFKAGSTSSSQTPSQNVVESGTSANGPFKISHDDVTIKVGETFTLTLKDASGNPVSVNWTVSNSSYCSVSGNSVTGNSVGTAKVYVPYAGQEFSCIVRVVK